MIYKGLSTEANVNKKKNYVLTICLDCFVRGDCFASASPVYARDPGRTKKSNLLTRNGHTLHLMFIEKILRTQNMTGISPLEVCDRQRRGPKASAPRPTALAPSRPRMGMLAGLKFSQTK